MIMSQSDNSRGGAAVDRSGFANNASQEIGGAPRLNSTTIPPPSALRAALAGLIGNVLEWFDFAVYGYFASDIGRQFFPQSSPTAQQLLAFAVFGVGFA